MESMEGKELVFTPAPSFLVYRYVNLVVGTVAGIAGIIWLVPITPTEIAGPVILLVELWIVTVLLCAAAAAAWYPAHTRSLRYAFERDRLAAHQGVWFRIRKFVPYGRITDVSISQGPLERRFGIHRLAVQTAGSPMPEAVLLGMVDPDGVRAALLERKTMLSDATGPEESDAVVLLREIRDELAIIRTELSPRTRP